MTEIEVVKLIRNEVSRAGSITKLACQLHVTQEYVSNLLSYRRSPGPKILDRLGLEKVVTIDYRLKESRR